MQKMSRSQKVVQNFVRLLDIFCLRIFIIHLFESFNMLNLFENSFLCSTFFCLRNFKRRNRKIFPFNCYTSLRENTPYLSVFSPNTGKYGPEQFRIWTLFTQYMLSYLTLSQYFDQEPLLITRNHRLERFRCLCERYIKTNWYMELGELSSMKL